MTVGCDELNRRYGAPERIVFREGPQGTPLVAIANQYGSAELSLFGAQVLSYRPTGNFPVLYTPPEVAFGPDKADHGGIPVCWPWFGKNGPEGSYGHGFARRSLWRVTGSEYSEDITEITLALDCTEETRRLWPHEFALQLKVSVSMKLNMGLKTTNTGSEPFEITEGFHPYFLVRDRDAVTVRGLDGCRYCDARKTRVADETWSGDLHFDTEYDHVFAVPADKNEFAIIDPGLRRAIAIASRGNAKLVCWNPGAVDLPDRNLAADDWRKFVCVEPATLFKEDATVKIAPGESHELLMAIQAVPEPEKK
jgi:D-hexose-6-phosphate mutarotase